MSFEKLGQELDSELDNSIINNSVTDEYLYEKLKDEFEKLNIIDTINLDDPYYIEEISEYIKSNSTISRYCVSSNSAEENTIYKILLKGYSNIIIHEYVAAIYIPRHINKIYIDNKYFIYLNDEYQSDMLNLMDLLEESKRIPTIIPDSFHDKYKKVVLMEPFIPNKTYISFDTDDIFYYEALISDIELSSRYGGSFLYIKTENTHIEDILDDVSSISDPSSIHNESNIHNKSNMHGDVAFKVSHVDDYIRLVYGSYTGRNNSWILLPNNLDKFNSIKRRDDCYRFEYVDMYRKENAVSDMDNHNNPILCMFIDRSNYEAYQTDFPLIEEITVHSNVNLSVQDAVEKEISSEMREIEKTAKTRELEDIIKVIENMYEQYSKSDTKKLNIDFRLTETIKFNKLAKLNRFAKKLNKSTEK